MSSVKASFEHIKLSDESQLAELNEKFDFYNSFLKDSTNTIDLYVALNEIEKACKNELILKLNKERLDRFNNTLLEYIDKTIQNYKGSQKTELSYKFNQLVDKYLSKLIAYNDMLLSQDITVDISPVNSNFTAEELNLSLTKSDSGSESKAEPETKPQKKLTLRNLHVSDLKIKEYLYGIDGHLVFELSYPNEHQDFDFLSNYRQPILLDIKIDNTLDIPIPNEKNPEKYYYKRLNRSLVIGNVIDISEYSYGQYKSNNTNIKKFKVSFSDPLKSLWKLHKPTYIDIQKSLDDIFKDNYFFDSLINLDSNKNTILKKSIEQAFISTINRNFYDFFIEQVKACDCVLKYFCDKETGKVTYYLVDKIEDLLKENIKNTDQDISTKFSQFDLISLNKQKLHKQQHKFHTKEKILTADIIADIEKDKSSNESPSELFSSIYKTTLNPVYYFNQPTPKTKQIKKKTYKLKLTARNVLPYVDTDINLSKLDTNSELLGTKRLKNLYIDRKIIRLKRSKYSTYMLREGLNNLYYKTESEADMYEKITFCKFSGLTHYNSVKYHFNDYNELKASYPKYKPFKGYDIVGKIVIGDNVNQDSIKAYKFFKNYKPEESSFSEFQSSQEKASSVLYKSKCELLYAVAISEEILGPKCSQKPTLYVPVKINVNSANNQFMPLRNDDIVLIQIQNINSCEILKILSNSAVSTKKAQEQLQQRQLLGAKENCEVAYTQANDEETYSVSQVNETSENYVAVNSKNGILLRYIAKGN